MDCAATKCQPTVSLVAAALRRSVYCDLISIDCTALDLKSASAMRFSRSRALCPSVCYDYARLCTVHRDIVEQSRLSAARSAATAEGATADRAGEEQIKPPPFIKKSELAQKSEPYV